MLFVSSYARTDMIDRTDVQLQPRMTDRPRASTDGGRHHCCARLFVRFISLCRHKIVLVRTHTNWKGIGFYLTVVHWNDAMMLQTVEKLATSKRLLCLL